MCGRYSLAVKARELAERWHLEEAMGFDLEPNYNVAPTVEMPVILRRSPLHAERMVWGLIPRWAKKPMGQINARAETVVEKPWFRDSFRRRRCIVPASGFFEWRKEGTAKQPHYFTLKNKQLMGFAGLYDEWKNPEYPDAPPMKTFTIITTEANKLMELIHHRMPVILAAEDEDDWLDPDYEDRAGLMAMLKPYPEDEMTEYEVTREMNKPIFNTIEAIEPLK